MRRYRPLVLLLACAICLAHAPCVMTGCQSTGKPRTERAQLKIATDAYATAKQAAADLWEAGKLDRDEKLAVMRGVRAGDKARKLWEKRLEENGPTETPRERLLRATNVLRNVWLQEQDQSNPASENEGDTE